MYSDGKPGVASRSGARVADRRRSGYRFPDWRSEVGPVYQTSPWHFLRVSFSRIGFDSDGPGIDRLVRPVCDLP